MQQRYDESVAAHWPSFLWSWGVNDRGVNHAGTGGIRPIAIGKKNWLFAGSERAGKRVAAIQSLLGTARLNGLDPHAWLKDTLVTTTPGSS